MTETAISEVLRRIAGGDTLEALGSLYRLSDENPLEAINRVLYAHTRESGNPTFLQACAQHQSMLGTAEGRERAVILYNLGCLALYQDEIVDAARHFEQASEFWPDWLPIFHNMAFTAELMADWDKAAELYREVIRRGPSFTLSRLNLALLMIQTGQQAEGQAELRALAAEEPANASLVLYLSRSLLESGSVTGAKEVMKLLESTGDWQRYPDLRECQAYACYILGRMLEAETSFKELLAEDTYNIFARMGMIKILESRRDFQELGNHARRLHEIDPSEISKRLLEQLEEEGYLI